MSPPRPDEIPPILGGENPWHWLSPEAEETLAALSEEQKRERLEAALVVSDAFTTAKGREALALMEEMIGKRRYRFQPGLTMDQTAALLLWNEAQRHMVEWIKQQIEIAKEG